MTDQPTRIQSAYQAHRAAMVAIPDAELAERVGAALKKLCRTGGQAFTMSVPVLTTDTDVMIAELLRRFKAQAAILSQRKPGPRKAGGYIIDVTKNGRVDTFTVQGEEELAELKQRMDALGVYYVVRP